MNRDHTPLTRTSTAHTRGYNAKISLETIEKIQGMVADGVDRMDVARALRISRVSVYRYAPVGRFEKVDHTPHIRKLYHEGMTQIEIHEKLGVSKTMVYRAVLGLPRRKPGPKTTAPRTPSQPSNASIAATRREEKKVTKATIKMEANHKEIRKLWITEMWTKTRIAKHLSLSFSTVEKAIFAMGIEDKQPKRTVKDKDPIAGKVKISVPEKRMEVWVYPHQVEQTKQKYGLTSKNCSLI